MAEKKGIILVGVMHTEKYLPEIKKLIDSYAGKVKTIGIEGVFPGDEKYYKNSQGNSGNVKQSKAKPYWDSIAKYAAEKGITVVPLDSFYAHAKLKELEEIVLHDSGMSLIDKLAGEYKIDKKARRRYLILAGPLRDEFIIKRIKKLKPQLVIVGHGHTFGIKKKIPVSKMHYIGSKAFRAYAFALRPISRIPYARLALTRARKRPAKKSRKHFHA